MIPVKLIIQGLYSYQEKQCIDFRKLTNANLFGIFGSVGSGKSSILEAITFALYGKTDRLKLSGDNRNYNMMNLKSNELLIDFIFETGKEQTSYRAVVKGRRNSKQFSDVKKSDRKAYQKINDEWIPVETDALEQAIGLSYENFKRTIIIPQGQFQEFLQLGNTERTKMMKELFNLEKFDLFYKLTAVESGNKGNIQNIEGQLQQLGEVEAENIVLYEQKIDHLKKENTKISETLNVLRKKETELRQLKELQKKLNIVRKELLNLKAKKTDFDKLKKRIRQFEYCHIQFKSLLDGLEVSTAKVEKKTAQAKIEIEKLSTTEKGIQKNKQQIRNIQDEYDTREKLKLGAEELVKVVEIKNLQEEIKKNTLRWEKGNEFCTKTKTNLETLQKNKTEKEEQVKSYRLRMPDLQKLSEIKNWFTEDKVNSEKAEELKREKQNQQAEINKINQELSALCSSEIFYGLPANSDLSATKKFLQNKEKDIKNKIQELGKKADHFRVQEKLKSFTENLREGEACPLCGAKNHPQIYNPQNTEDAQTEIDKEKELLNKQTEQVYDTSRKLDAFEHQLAFNKGRFEKLTEDEKGLKIKSATHKNNYKWEKYNNVQEVDLTFSEARKLQAAIQKTEKQQETISTQISKAEKDDARFRQEIEKIETALTVGKTQLKTLKKQLTLTDSKEYTNKTSEETEAESKNMLEKYRRIEKQYNELTESLKILRSQKDILLGSLDAGKKELEEETKLNNDLKQKLEGKLQNSAFQTLDEVKKILASEENLEKEKKTLEKFEKTLTQTQSREEQLIAEMGKGVYESAEHEKIQTEIEELKIKQQEGEREYGRITELLKKLKADLEKLTSLKKELEKLRLREDNIKTLKSLFKASGFVNYISSVYLQNLCNAANDRFFRLTRQKLSLEISEDNNFQVRDFMNGGKIRSVKTLSGGQTFQAALSLALALADNIQKITASNQNFFFLDEGFGALDKEALSVVFDTLKSLRKEDRIVGVISHVEEMQQEIDIHLKVTNSEERGSLISRSWEN